MRRAEQGHLLNPAGLLLIGADRARALGLGSSPCWLCSQCYTKLVVGPAMERAKKTSAQVAAGGHSSLNTSVTERYGLVA